MSSAKAYAVHGPADKLAPFSFERRDTRPFDVQLDILYCGVCHSDIHQSRSEWEDSIYPMVPGHEIIGRVTKTGPEVTKFKVGDLAAVGVMVDSCRKCRNCNNYVENYCAESMTGTYKGMERDGKTIAQGGDSTLIVTDERYVYHISPSLAPAAAAPVLSAGITISSPLGFPHVAKGKK